MIRICADIGLSHIPYITLAAALKEVFRLGGRKKRDIPFLWNVENRDILIESV
jgi:hypothetical protein